MRVLVIEADEDLRARYTSIFSEFGISFVIVSSVQEAVSAITDAQFTGSDLSIVIIGDKQQDSYSVTESASYISGSYPELTIVLVGRNNWDEIEYHAMKCGIRGFIPVPFFKRSLINGLSEAVSSYNENGGPVMPDLAGKNILLVEDNMINREIAKEMLDSTGASVYTAEDGKQAVDAFVASEPGFYSIVLMDVQMPVMDGYAATRAIRQSGREDSSVPIFAMTANTFAEDIAKARESGMNGHISKPVDIDSLISTICRNIR